MFTDTISLKTVPEVIADQTQHQSIVFSQYVNDFGVFWQQVSSKDHLVELRA